MEDDVSAYMHIALMVWFTAALLAIVVGILATSVGLMHQFGDKFSNAVVIASDTSVKGLSSARTISGASAYASINSSINSIDIVYVVDKTGVSTCVYRHKGGLDNLTQLMTLKKNKTYRMSLTEGLDYRSMITVTLQEVDR